MLIYSNTTSSFWTGLKWSKIAQTICRKITFKLHSLTYYIQSCTESVRILRCHLLHLTLALNNLCGWTQFQVTLRLQNHMSNSQRYRLHLSFQIPRWTYISNSRQICESSFIQWTLPCRIGCRAARHEPYEMIFGASQYAESPPSPVKSSPCLLTRLEVSAFWSPLAAFSPFYGLTKKTSRYLFIEESTKFNN